jgi:ANTAR domain-containing protein
VVGRRHDRLWRLVTERVHEHADGAGWAAVVCAVAVDHIDVDAAAITIRTSVRMQELVAATGEWAESLEELQYTVGEGPGVEAFTSGGPVLVSDMGAEEHRWPGFGDEASSSGAGAVFAFPLQVGAIRLGTLDLYRRVAGGLGVEGLADAVALADLAVTALLSDTRIDDDPVALWARHDVPGFYDDVNVATGMLATQLRISLEDAMLRLRAHAFSHHLPLTEVARAVLNRQLRLDSSTE